jgi:hypothetical protein
MSRGSPDQTSRAAPRAPKGVRVRGWLGGKQHRRGQVVEEHRCEGANFRRAPHPGRVEQRRPAPETGDRAKADRERKQKPRASEAGP